MEVLYTKPIAGSTEIIIISYPMNTGYRTNKITEITAYAFYNNKMLVFLELYERLKTINNNTFANI